MALRESPDRQVLPVRPVPLARRARTEARQAPKERRVPLGRTAKTGRPDRLGQQAQPEHRANRDRPAHRGLLDRLVLQASPVLAHLTSKWRRRWRRTVPPTTAVSRHCSHRRRIGTVAATNRILWNKRGRDIDEIVVSDVDVVHVEQMSDRCWWIGITRADGGSWAGNFICDSRGRMTFSEQEHEGFDWERDDTHELSPPP